MAIDLTKPYMALWFTGCGKNFYQSLNSELRIGFLPVLLYVKRGEETKTAVDPASALCAYIKSPKMRTMPGKAWRIRAERHFSIEKMVKSFETGRYMEKQHPCKRIHMLLMRQ